MFAMIMAAGLGTRLRPWTERHPKALVPVGGKPMLGRVLDKLREEGFSRAVVNVHHFSDQIKDFVAANDFGIDVRISDESGLLLDTGGGICHAAPLLREAGEPVLVHNVDILSDAPLADLVAYHRASGNDVTLLTSDRASSRRLVFDGAGCLRGWHNLATDAVRPEGFAMEEDFTEEAFSGIYVLSPAALDALEEYRENKAGGPAFPIMDFLLSFPHGVRIGRRFQARLRLIDIGKPDTLSEARRLFGQ